MNTKLIALAALAGIITTGAAYAQFMTPLQPSAPGMIPYQPLYSPPPPPPSPMIAHPFFTQPVAPPQGPTPMMVYPANPTTFGYGR